MVIRNYKLFHPRNLETTANEFYARFPEGAFSNLHILFLNSYHNLLVLDTALPQILADKLEPGYLLDVLTSKVMGHKYLNTYLDLLR